MNTFTLEISDELVEQQRPIGELAIEAIRQYVVVEQLRSLRRRSVPYARAQGFLTDEDVFREIS